jgi:hypothetical protein
MRRAWIGADPGGKHAFGVAALFDEGTVESVTVSFADEAIDWIVDKDVQPLGAGVDAPLWWSSGRSGERHADRWIRRTYGIPSGTVQAANSLRGAALVQGAMFVSRIRERFLDLPVTEAHPKAVVRALAGTACDAPWDGSAVTCLGNFKAANEHERDARFAAVSAREGFQRRWCRDLSIKRLESEQDPSTCWLGPVHYYWPAEPTKDSGCQTGPRDLDLNVS